MNKFNLRTLRSSDMFTMFRLLKKIGFDKLKNSLSPETVSQITEGNVNETVLGINVIMDVLTIVLDNLPNCEQDLYKFLSDLSGMKPEAIADLSMTDFTEMIVEVVQKKEFVDFIKVVSGLFNKEQNQEQEN